MAENNVSDKKDGNWIEIEDSIRTIGVLTSGGDAPGMNAAIRAVVRTALSRGLKVRGIRRGYHGLLKEEIIDLSAARRIRYNPAWRYDSADGALPVDDTEEGQQKAAAICKKYGIDGLVVIGGDGSFAERRSLRPWGKHSRCSGNHRS